MRFGRGELGEGKKMRRESLSSLLSDDD